jgi:hypothetical protein
MKQTAVEWLENEFQEICKDFGGLHTDFIEKFKQAKEMEKEQMQMTWNNAIDAVQKDKWESYDDFYNNNFKSE